MKLLLDQGLARRAAELLRGAGIDATHVAEIGMEKADDDEILARAVVDNATVVTLDADFHSLLALTGAMAPSVIRIRIERLKADQVASLLQIVLAQVSDDLAKGAVVTVQPTRIRVHSLPIRGSKGQPP
jgi:predicted nuclease of predicted toxin-antitoxin system